MLTQPFTDFRQTLTFVGAFRSLYCSIPIAMENVGSSARPQVLIDRSDSRPATTKGSNTINEANSSS